MALKTSDGNSPQESLRAVIEAKSNARRILLIEDDLQIAQLIVTELEDVGFDVSWAANGFAGLELQAAGDAQLIVLDLNLPDQDGLDVCSRIRGRDLLIPILMLTARATRSDVVRGLELGADEYMTKPFDTLELVARVRALFRRIEAYAHQGRPDGGHPSIIRHRQLSIDTVRREVQLGAKAVVLTAKEFDLLLLFVKHPGRTFTRDELLNRVWGDGFEGFEHTVNTHINRLRSKIELDVHRPALIETVWGVGYRLADARS